jgi:GNAT superfamily N-acetyltransferase
MTDVRLIVIRGNSGAGKTSVSRGIQQAYGRGVAWVSQDMLRRLVLREHERPGGRNIGLIEQTARFALGNGYHVVLDGILSASRYESMLAALRHDHSGPSYFYYLDVSLPETLRRHQTRPERAEIGAADLRSWYKRRDLLSSISERLIPEASTLSATVGTILAETGLLAAVQFRAEPAAAEDLASWLQLAREVETLFGPMPDFAAHAARAVERNSGIVVRDRDDAVLGAALTSHRPGDQHINWLAVRESARRRGVAKVLLAEILRRWPGPGDVDVATFGPDVPGGAAARAFYLSAGFVAAEMLPAAADGRSRQRFVLARPA